MLHSLPFSGHFATRGLNATNNKQLMGGVVPNE